MADLQNAAAAGQIIPAFLRDHQRQHLKEGRANILMEKDQNIQV